jgi:dihydroflavonol-4-reductase
MILITGATGLTGSHLALHLLENGATIRAIYRDQNGINKTRALFNLYGKTALFDKIEWVEAGILDIPALEKAFKNVDFVYHCAAHISFDPADEEILRKTNIEGTANVVSCCLDFGVKKLCYVSSIAALGDLKDFEDTVTEETEWNSEKPHSDYAISKHGAEMEIWRAQQEGLSIVVVNPGVILGPGFWHSGSGEIFTRVAKGLTFYTNGKTGFVGVWDVVKIMAQLMESGISGERFIVVSETVSFHDIENAIADALKVKRPNAYASPGLTALAASIDWFLSLFGKKRVLSKDGARALHSMTFYSNEKIRKALDFNFTPIKETIAETAKLKK